MLRHPDWSAETDGAVFIVEGAQITRAVYRIVIP